MRCSESLVSTERVVAESVVPKGIISKSRGVRISCTEAELVLIGRPGPSVVPH